MKVELITKQLQDGLRKVSRISGKHATLPVLECILLEASESTLTLHATNLDLGIEVVIPAKVLTPGTVAVPGAVLTSYIQNLHDDSVVCEVEDSLLSIQSSHHTTKVNVQDATDFPTIPKVTPEYGFALSPQDMQEGVSSVVYAGSAASMRPELASIFLYTKDNGICFVATDIFRLAERTILAPQIEAFSGVLIPLKNIIEITRVFSDDAKEIEILVSGNQIAFVSDGIYVTSRVIEGNFPDYEQIIPTEFTCEVTLLKQDLIDVFKVTTIFSEKLHKVRVCVQAEDGSIVFTTRNAEVGEHTSTLKGKVEGEDLEQLFNHKYIAECLTTIDSDSVTLSFAGINKPLIIQGKDDDRFRYLVSPMTS